MQNNMSDLMRDGEPLPLPARSCVDPDDDPIPITKSESGLGAIEIIANNQRTLPFGYFIDWDRGFDYSVFS